MASCRSFDSWRKEMARPPDALVHRGSSVPGSISGSVRVRRQCWWLVYWCKSLVYCGGSARGRTWRPDQGQWRHGSHSERACRTGVRRHYASLPSHGGSRASKWGSSFAAERGRRAAREAWRPPRPLPERCMRCRRTVAEGLRPSPPPLLTHSSYSSNTGMEGQLDIQGKQDQELVLQHRSSSNCWVTRWVYLSTKHRKILEWIFSSLHNIHLSSHVICGPLYLSVVFERCARVSCVPLHSKSYTVTLSCILRFKHKNVMCVNGPLSFTAPCSKM